VSAAAAAAAVLQAGKPPAEPLERFLAELEMRLQLGAEEVEAALGECSGAGLRRVPFALQEVSRLRGDVNALQVRAEWARGMRLCWPEFGACGVWHLRQWVGAVARAVSLAGHCTAAGGRERTAGGCGMAVLVCSRPARFGVKAVEGVWCPWGSSVVECLGANAAAHGLVLCSWGQRRWRRRWASAAGRGCGACRLHCRKSAG
jgi:hypothetical protein